MHIWEMTRAEFMGVSSAPGDIPSPTVMGWEGYEGLIKQYPERQFLNGLTGRNAAYGLYRALDDFGRSILLVIHGEGAERAEVGLLDDNLLVVHEKHRGQGLAEELVLAGVGKNAVQNPPREITQASEKALARTHELAVRRAHAHLEDVPKRVLDEYGLKPLFGR